MNLKFSNITVGLDSKKEAAYRLPDMFCVLSQKQKGVYIQIYSYLGVCRKGIMERLD